ncbi:hypothetical protein EPN18_01740 [bacterium]|nr:MAG: hypothetical protein EPN18_01740 [bacterium]
MPKSPANRHFLALIFYISAVALIFAPVVFGSKTLQPDMYQPNGLVNGWPYGYKGRLAKNSFNVDLPTPAYYEWPINKTVGDIYKRGEFPLWNAHQGAGTPLLADYSSRALFPYQIIENIMPVEAWDFFYLGRLVIAGFFTYLFLALCGLASAPSLLGGLFYMFGGTLIWFVNLEQFANVAMTIPAVMYFTELFARKTGKSEIALLGASYALVMLAGQPEAALYALYLSAAYIAFRTIHLYGAAVSCLLSAWLKAAVALLIGLCLAAPLIIPFIENVYYGYHVHQAGAGIGVQFSGNWLRAFAVFTPAATEMPADPSILPEVLVNVKNGYGRGEGYYRVFATKGAWDYLGGYTGILPVFLIVTGVFTAFYRRGLKEYAALMFFFAFGLSIILKNFGVAPFVWLGYLPFFDQAWSPRWAGPAWVFAFACAGAFALQAIMDSGELLLKGRAEERISIKKNRLLYLPLIVVVVLAAFMATAPLPGIIDMAINRRAFFGELLAPYAVPSIVLAQAFAFLVLVIAGALITVYMKKGIGIYGLIALGMVELWWNVPRGYAYDWIYYKLALAVIGLTAAFLFLIKKEKARCFAAGVMSVIFLAAFLKMDAMSPNGFPERFNPFKNEPPYISFLKGREGSYRVMGGYGILMPNYAGSVGLYDLRYINALVSKEYKDFRNNSLLVDDIANVEREGSALWFTGMPQWITLNHDEKIGRHYKMANKGVEKDITARLPDYSLMGVRYILMPPEVDLNKGSRYNLPLIYDKEVRVYENPYAFPRAFVADLEAEAITRIEKADPAAANITLDKALFNVGARGGRDGIKEAVIKEYGANKAVIETGYGRAGLLVFSDTAARGWTAYVNGKPSAIYKVGGVIRGVLLKQGKNTVVFRYMPHSFKAGVVLFTLSLIAVIVMVLPRKRGGRGSSSVM